MMKGGSRQRRDDLNISLELCVYLSWLLMCLFIPVLGLEHGDRKYVREADIVRNGGSYPSVNKANKSSITGVCPVPCSCTRAADHSIRSVNCSGRSLNSYPRLPHTVTVVRVNANRISSVTASDLGQTPQLVYLNMCNNELSTLGANVFSKVPHLTELGLSHNAIAHIETNAFQGLYQLQYLDLSNNKYLSFAGVKNATLGLSKSNLTHFDITEVNEKLAEIPWNLFSSIINTPLKTLVLSSNTIYGFNPLFFVCLPKSLEHLFLQWNSIQFAEGLITVQCLENLRVLDLSHQVHYTDKRRKLFSRVPRLNHNLSRLSSTKELCHPQGPWNCRLPTASPHTDDKEFTCPDIRPTSSRSNSISNRFQSLTATCHCPGTTATNHTASKSASQRSNSIRITPSATKNDMGIGAGHTIRSTTAGLPFPAKLEQLIVNDVNLRYSIPQFTLRTPNSLRRLEYASNPDPCWGGPIAGVPLLEYLDLSDNGCSIVNLDFFISMSSVTTLIIKRNSFSGNLFQDKTGRFFSYLYNLKILDMSQNIITKLQPNVFSNNSKLQYLNLSHNYLEDFYVDIGHMSYLESFNISDNLLGGFSEDMTSQIREMKANRKTFRVDMSRNPLQCSCEYVDFLQFLCTHPDAFVNADGLNCTLPAVWGGAVRKFPLFCETLPRIAIQCLSEDIFMGALVSLSLIVVLWGLTAVVYRYRWKINYLYYIGKQRLNIGGRILSYEPVADVYITYDEDDLECRRVAMMFRRRLNDSGLTTILGELDFPAGTVLDHVCGAFLGTRKTLLLLSSGLFPCKVREFEFNMLVLYEMEIRGQILVPVFLNEVELERDSIPREVIVYLEAQRQRCRYYRDCERFWEALIAELQETTG